VTNRYSKYNLGMQKYVIGMFFLGVFMVVWSCNQTASEAGLVSEGEALAIKYCLNCHNPTSGQKARIAPPLIQIRDVYLSAYGDRDSFVAAIVDFVLHPEANKALLDEAVAQFGLMPRLSYKPEVLEQIAIHMLDDELVAPDWYKGLE